MKGRTRKTVELVVVDHVARAVHLWVRHLVSTERLNLLQHSAAVREALIGGLITGVCDGLNLAKKERKLTAYVYALLDEEGDAALRVSKRMIQHEREPLLESAYRLGLSEAEKLIARLLRKDLSELSVHDKGDESCQTGTE